MLTQLKRNDSILKISNWCNRHIILLFSLPAMIFVVLMVAAPTAYTFWLALTSAEGAVGLDTEFVGLANFEKLLRDAVRFWPAVSRTLVFTFGSVIIQLILGMGIALLMRQSFKGEKYIRMVVLLPVVATPVAVGMMWMLMFEPTIGFANELLSWFGIAPQGWMSSPSQALPTLIFVDVWQWTPMVTLILLAGLTSLPIEPDEAARVDGATTFQRFRHVTLPLLRPVVVTAVLLRAIDALKTFDILYATKGKGGGSSHEVETLNVYGYTLSFDYNQYSLASAMLILFLVLIVIFCVILLRNMNSRKDLGK